MRFKYDRPIESPEHAIFCRREAARRYGGKVIKEPYYGMLVVEDEIGLTHTDDVLRALSFYNRTPQGSRNVSGKSLVTT